MTLRSHCALATLSLLATAALAATAAAELPANPSVDPSTDSPMVNGSVVDQTTADRQNLPPGLHRGR